MNASKRRWLTTLAIGLTVKDLTDRAFDYILYPYVIYRLGIIKGGLIMSVLACALNLLTLKFYDWSKRDWLGIEALKGLKDYSGPNRWARLWAWIMRRSDLIVMTFLSIKEDAFIALIYMRHGSHQYNGMTGRDWKIFFTSVVIANVYWTLAASMGVTLVEWAWAALHKV
jgi:hypothetical protein